MAVEVKQYKVVICGASKTGKTSFVRRFLTGDFDTAYTPTLGVEIHPLVFNFNKGYIQFNVWDCSGTDGMKGLGDGYYINSDCAILFVDDDREWKTYIRDLHRVKSDLPIVLVRNKIDLVDSGWDWTSVIVNKVASNCLRFDISAKSNYDIEKPFLHLARHFNGEDTVFTETDVSSIGPEVKVDENVLADYKQEMTKSLASTHHIRSTPSDDEM